MRVLTAFGLVVLVASLVTCEARNSDRCLLPDYPCEAGKFCKSTGDMGGVGTCMAAECTFSTTPSAASNGCNDPSTPICTTEGRCVACSSSQQCKSTFLTTPICTDPGGAGTCVECMASTDCTSDPTRPACNQTKHVCEPCSKHSQCPSLACVKDNTLANLPNGQALALGTCVPPGRVLTVDDSASPATTLQGMISTASAAKPYILIKNYKTKVAITVPAISGLPELHIITTTADQSPAQLTSTPSAAISFFNSMNIPAITIQPGASVTLEGVAITNNAMAVLCDSDNSRVATTTPLPTSLKLIRSIIGSSDTAITTHPKCQLTVDSSWIGTLPMQNPPVNGNLMAINANSTQFDIVNSVFVHNYGTVGMLNGMFGGISISDSMGLGLTGHIVNCTFDRHEPSDGLNHNAMAVYCPGTTRLTKVSIFNNIFVNSTPSGGRHYVDPNCINIASTSYGYSATDESPAPSGAGITGIVTSGVSEAMLTATMALQSNAPMTVINGGALGLPNDPTAKSPAYDMNGVARNSMNPSMGAFELAH